MTIFPNLADTSKKYLVCALLLSLAVAAGVMVACSPAGRSRSQRGGRTPIFDRSEQAARDTVAPTTAEARGEVPQGGLAPFSSAEAIASIEGIELPEIPDAGLRSDTARLSESHSDSIRRVFQSLYEAMQDSIASASVADTLRGTDSLGRADSLRPMLRPYRDSLLTDLEILEEPDVEMRTGRLNIMADTAGTKKPFLDHAVIGKARDSLVYDVRNRLVFVYGQGDLTYEDDDGSNLKADHMILNATTKEIFGVGVMDTVTGMMTRPEFIQGAANYTMDTITYNLDSKKAKIKGVATRDGEGFLLGRDLKKMPDNTVNIAHAKYTTCDNVEHPHFYIAMTKAKVIPGKKIITGPAYFVMEDVPVYFLGIPGGFFPISSGPQSGFVMPNYGEESRRGFYLRDGGYYFTFGDYADLKVTGDIYTLGSWAVRAQSNYLKRYKFAGSFSADYSRDIIGEKNGPDYQNMGNFKLLWNHRMDPKARPGTMFSASVNFATAGYSKNSATTLQDHLNTNTSSSISYSRSWMAGTTPINLTVAFQHSSSSRDTVINLTLPNISFSVGSFAPFKRRVQVGKQRWYEKITISYSMSAMNATAPNTKEYDLFTKKTLREMQNGVSHKIPIKTSFNMLGYITFSPSFNYNETWNFQRKREIYDPEIGGLVDPRDVESEFGFYRLYNWDVNGSFSTKLYVRFTPKYKPGRQGWLNAVRWVLTPTAGFTYSPDFRDPRYGMVQYVQTDSLGHFKESDKYIIGSPTMRHGPPKGSINFSLSNQIEAKVRSKKDTTGTGLVKIPLIEQLSASGSYNFLVDSLRLSTISLSLRTGNLFGNFALQLNASWDPYVVIDNGKGQPTRLDRFNVGRGKFGRIASTGWSAGYTWQSSNSAQPAMNDINSGAIVTETINPWDYSVIMEPALRRQHMVSNYYDFTIPWNFGFNYSINYSNNGLRTNVTQTLGFQGSVTLTEKWGVTFNGGFDLQKMQFTPMSVNIARNLHCWSMTFQWIPLGALKSYQFHIGVLSGMLADIKYDKQSSRYDNLMQ